MSELTSLAEEPGSTSRKLRYAICAALALSTVGVAAGENNPYMSAERYDVGTGVGQTPMRKGLVFVPRLDAAIQYVSNIALAPDDQEKIDTAGVEVTPGFYASYYSGAFLGAIDYSLIGRKWDESDYDDVSHRLNANGEWYAIPEWFSFRGQATYQDTVIDPLQGANSGSIGLFNAGNLAELATASLNPHFDHKFGGLQATADYQYGRTWYLDEGKGLPTVGFVSNQDSRDQSASASFGTAKDNGGRFNASVYYDWQKSEYDTSLPYEYERAGVDLDVKIARTLSLLGEVGQESDLDESTTQAGLDSTFWNVGLRYEPSDRTSIEGRYGERFFGSSWSASIRHRARLVEFTASYSEEPTIESRQLSLGQFEPGQLPPSGPPVDFGRINSSPYVAKDATFGVRAAGSKTTLDLTGYYLDRSYLSNVRADEKDTGFTFTATRQLGSKLSMDFDLGYTQYERSSDVLSGALDGDSRDTHALLRLNRKAGRTLTFSAEAGYTVRSGELPDADGWWVGLRTRWSPATPER